MQLILRDGVTSSVGGVGRGEAGGRVGVKTSWDEAASRVANSAKVISFDHASRTRFYTFFAAQGCKKGIIM